jgi:integrase/recombinase XerD
MRPFKSFLTPKLEEYLRHRSVLGYRNKNIRSLFRSLDRYVYENAVDWNCLTPLFFLRLRGDLKKENSTVNGILSGARCFFQFLVHQGLFQQNPLSDIPPLSPNQYVPFIFSPEETEELLSIIIKRFTETNDSDFKYASIYLAVLLMAKCGLRISEPFRILITHYRRDEGTIYLEKTKFHSDRLIPVPKAVMNKIERYLEIRNSQQSGKENPYLLLGFKQKPLLTHHVYPVFHQALTEMGIERKKHKLGKVSIGSPCPHSLRHSFAINTLNHIKKRGKATQDALPILATYMGHRNIKSTGSYLLLTDALHRQKLVEFLISKQEVL